MKFLRSLVFFLLSLLSELSFSQGITGRYPFDGNIDDVSGNARNGTLFGNPSVSGTLVIPDDVTAHASLPVSVVNGLTDLAVSVNVRFHTLHLSGNFPTNTILQGTRSNEMNPFAIAYEAANNRFRIVFEATNYDFPFVASANVWYCIAVVRQGAVLNLYVDGSPLNSGYSVVTGPVSVDTLLVGQEQDCVGGCFAQDQSLAGELDDLQIGTTAGPDFFSCSIPVSNVPVAPTLSGGGIFCSGTPVTLTAVSDQAATVYWFADPLKVTLLDSGSIFSPPSNQNSTYYAIQVLNGRESAVSAVSVQYIQTPQAIATSSVQSGIPPLTVDFTNNSTGASTFYWTFGNGESSALMNPTVTYEHGGNYEVQLIAYNSGCSDTTSLEINVSEISHLNVPNIFTPNFDGANDLFLIDHLNLVEYNIKVFDRWGILVFSSDKPNQAWDGATQAGVKVSAGTYFYVIHAKGLDNAVHDLHGSIQLIR